MYQLTKEQEIELTTPTFKVTKTTHLYRVTDRFGNLIIESSEDTEIEARQMALAIYEQNPDSAVAKVNGTTIARKVF